MKQKNSTSYLSGSARALGALCTSVVLGAVAVGCVPNVKDPQEQSKEQLEANQPISNAMGKATPVPSPEAAGELPGQDIDLGADWGNITDIAAVGDVLAVRSGHRIGVGTIEQLRNNTFTTLQVNADCGDLEGAQQSFVLACPTSLSGGAGGGEVAIIDPARPTLEKHYTAPMPFTAATITTDGVIIAGSATEPDLYAFRGEDSRGAKKIQTGRKTHQIVSSPVPDSRDAVVYIDRDTTAIQGVDYRNDQQGAALRMGVGVGTIAAGDDGLVFAADTRGHQFGLYTDTDVLRLHQTLPTDESPWAIVADPQRDAVWVASNAKNTVQPFTYNTGVPVGHGKIDTPAQVRAMALTKQGEVVLASENSSKIHVVSAKIADQAVDKQS
ncbi:hypothetical protein QVA66_00460 [Staphylococcus chromogenes]|nr:hypothetical protein [Staphylococcus chromogenes]